MAAKHTGSAKTAVPSHCARRRFSQGTRLLEDYPRLSHLFAEETHASDHFTSCKPGHRSILLVSAARLSRLQSKKESIGHLRFSSREAVDP